ncbi:hypothetical protein DTW90_22955 [Neorhizobium sp. P12A]|uniref:hypothetical protein n=1 Tax=Neorhizobium sp. P12A TaxID=2268027 RepID=UPI0011EC5688|nr:hypothetical protein [Neorhizobium sp. P12A]KAA0695427.1 hypothetical protein DTW90_22955 [Neorhizobium sp. P12A]
MNDEQTIAATEMRELMSLLNKAIRRATVLGLRVNATVEETHAPSVSVLTPQFDLSMSSDTPPTLGEALAKAGFKPYDRSRVLLRDRRSREPLKRRD